MIIYRRDAQGRPRDIELNDLEMVVKEIHCNLMDRGLDAATALLYITAADLPTQPNQMPGLNEALRDLEFRAYLAD